METRTRRTWTFVFGFMELMSVGSSPDSSLVSTRSGVGLQVVLPCTWNSHKEASSTTPYIQWQIFRDIVYERKGPAQIQAEAYQDRADVPESVLARGNCSLHLSDIRFSDAGVYECYLVVGRTGNKRRIFIQSVQLSVLDHKIIQSVETGKDLTLDLYTQQAQIVVFQKFNGLEWRELWQRRGSGENRDPRVEMRNGKLLIRDVSASDEGIYKVMDGDGLALSTVKVSVKEPPPPRSTTVMDKRFPSVNSGGENSPALPLSVLFCMLLFLL